MSKANLTHGWTGGSLLTILVLTLTVAGTIASFAVARAVVREQNARLLSQRAAEINALLRVTINGIDNSLEILGPMGASSDPAVRALFARSAAPQLEGQGTALGVAVENPSGFTVTALEGDGPEAGEPLTGSRAELARRAVARAALVANLIADDGVTRLVFARPVRGTRAVAFRESNVRRTPAASTSTSAYRGLQVALYASPALDVDRLVITTEPNLPLADS